MDGTSTKFKTIDELHLCISCGHKKILKELRKAVKEAAPQAQEVISYNIPALKLKGILVCYAAYERHIGFYPTPSAIEAFKNELSKYKGAKGSVQFPIQEPLPFDLISKIVKFKVQEDLEKEKVKRKK